jgi:thiamine biosynthesis lipoprotein
MSKVTLESGIVSVYGFGSEGGGGCMDSRHAAEGTNNRMNNNNRIAIWLFRGCSTIAAVMLFLTIIADIASAQLQKQRHSFAARHMGTEFRITICGDAKLAENAATKAFARAKELDDKLSDYKPDSELMKLCEKAGQGPIGVSDDLFTVMSEAQRIAKASNGAFDATVGPIVRLWRLARRTREMPAADETKAAMAKIGYEKVRLDAVKKTIALAEQGMKLDLGGIAKGFAAEEMVKVLRESGCPRCLVAAGGDIFAGDAPDDADGWSISIAPLGPGDKPPTLIIANASVSTSGDAEQHVEIAGKRYAHIVDPKTGLGLVGQFSITVLAKSGATADALATAAAVLGPECGVKLVESLGGQARFVWKVEERLQVRGELRTANRQEKSGPRFGGFSFAN